ncbi:hypothetical protein C1H69_14685 [Billgrantia endophytica]|uniref:Uncharacterized protein n=1 Tax=Billgrantia endophytica TaxID=2033802 RepID=A0A2N7U223_9GAMM|nr:hypothetical protein C1H69_14685 [Halomonas endophytica]
MSAGQAGKSYGISRGEAMGAALSADGDACAAQSLASLESATVSIGLGGWTRDELVEPID